MDFLIDIIWEERQSFYVSAKDPLPHHKNISVTARAWYMGWLYEEERDYDGVTKEEYLASDDFARFKKRATEEFTNLRKQVLDLA